MAYEKTNWIDNETKVSAAKMNKIEEKLFSLDANKIDKDGNKVLSTEDYTSTEKAKVANLPADTNAQLADKALKTEVGTLANLLTTAKTSIVNAINELFNNKANKAQEESIYPTLLNGWIEVGSVYHKLRYYKDSLGYVHIEGGVNGTNGTNAVIFNLPAGYRLLSYNYAPVSVNLLSAATQLAAVTIRDSVATNFRGTIFLNIVYKPEA